MYKLVHINFILFFFHASATSKLYTLSLHDALPIFFQQHGRIFLQDAPVAARALAQQDQFVAALAEAEEEAQQRHRSEEHTSELQSRFDLVCRLLLEKKNITNYI